MNLPNDQSRWAYMSKLSDFPISVAPVATAVPAFIGYTPQAMYEGKSCMNVPQRISSFSDFEALYCFPNPAAPASQVKQYSPECYLVLRKEMPVDPDYLIINGDYYSVLPDPNTIYYLYNSVKLFYDNGGGDAYIVSVGTYGLPLGRPIISGTQLVNPNVKLAELMAGLQLLRNEQEPTLYICPEATLLSVAENGTLMKSMLLQCTETQTAMCLFDVIGGRNPDPGLYMQDILTFRNNTGVVGLDYGAAYYPFIGTSIMQTNDIDYTNLFGGDTKQLEPLLNPYGNPNPVAAQILANIASPSGTPLTVTQYHNALLNASETYKAITNLVLVTANILPPSGAMAGIITITDNQIGCWQAPANVSIVGATSLTISLSESQQASLNMDAITGKSINAIRFFNGIGILVWGARTLDGNSQDWKYIQVRRTLTFLEQSCKLACHPYVFQPNDKNTWEAVKSIIGSFLTSVWKEGGLMGSTPSDAFSVDCGLGVTMTGDDVLNGIMTVVVKVAVIRPAEFMVITFQQQMASPG
ncbi:phage tail sheath C-terminal domain-containing protein [Pedobacter foliorum]|uniref:phage tail sheath family protein n=1 Tax=Pedobacter foliorum TaxID=2739058 RepID=UPI001563698A|nr:phage tail sheath C-terminal domain-containing protein [Pedobacter foliorum]NRF37411.1 phage tail sheath family protein [Pedobacter foliorum]